jgi:outer membrane protein assembly factor BamB
MKFTFFSRLAAFAAAFAFLPSSATAAIPGMKIVRLTSPEPAEGRGFGSECVLTDRYAVVADASIPSDLGIINQGRVRVYDAGTGKLVRTLKASHPETVKYFGRTLAVHGNLLLVGCYTEQVFLFDLSTGKQLRTFLRPGPENAAFFGHAMQLTERYAIISHPSAAVYVYDLTNTEAPLALTPPDPNNIGWYGSSVYCHDQILLVGHPFDATDKGAVYRFDLTTGQLLGSLQAPDGKLFDRLGSYLGGAGQTAFVGNHPNVDAGKAYSISLTGQIGAGFNHDPEAGNNRRFFAGAVSGNLAAWWAGGHVVISEASGNNPFLTITGADLDTNAAIGNIGLAANRLLLGCPQDGGSAANAGAAFLVQTVNEPLPGAVVAVRGAPAPGAAEITFNNLNASAIDSSGRVVVASSLKGKGSNAGRDSAVFDDLANAGVLDLLAKSRDDLGSGLRVTSVAAPVMNNGYALFSAKIAGTGVTTANNRLILRSNGASVLQLLRTGQTLAPFDGAALASFGALAQSSSTSYFSTVIRLRGGAGGATPENDSGLLTGHSNMPSLAEGVREGSPTGMSGVDFRQFVPRVSHQNGAAAFTAMVSGATTENQAVFTKAFGGLPVLVARKGAPAHGIDGGFFSSFLSENVTAANTVVFRAKVSGTGIRSTNNEGLWFGPAALPDLVARTGSPVPGFATGVVWSRFLQVCPQNDRLLIRARLRGPGIRATNDEILGLYQEDKSFLVLYREGESLPGGDGARGGFIRRLEANIDGTYRLLVGLTRSRTAANLALLGGNTLKGTAVAGSSLRKPELKLRKGSVLSNGLGGSAKLTALTFANTQSQDSSGMSCKGLPNLTGSVGTLLRLSFSNRALQIVRMP